MSRYSLLVEICKLFETVAGVLGFFHLELRLDEACISQVDFVDGPLVQGHVSVVAALQRD